MELLVIIAIIGVLIGLLLPAVQSARESARRISCANGMKQLGLAMQGHESAMKRLPPGSLLEAGFIGDAWKSGYVYLLPFIEELGLSNVYNGKLPWDHAENASAVSREIRMLFCPSNRSGGSIAFRSRTLACTDYAMNAGMDNIITGRTAEEAWHPMSRRGPFMVGNSGWNKGTRFNQVLDGLTKTYLAGEVAGGNRRFAPRDGTSAQVLDQAWALPVYDLSVRGSVVACSANARYSGTPDNLIRTDHEAINRTDPISSMDYEMADGDSITGFRSMHPNGALFVLCDGATIFVEASIDPAVHRAMSTMAGSD